MQKVPPKLIIQVWDNDKFSADDFIGKVFERDEGPWELWGKNVFFATSQQDFPLSILILCESKNKQKKNFKPFFL